MVQFLERADREEQETAILYRTNQQGIRLSLDLYREGISFRFLDGVFDPFKRAYIRDILSFLRCSVRSSEDEFIRIADKILPLDRKTRRLLRRIDQSDTGMVSSAISGNIWSLFKFSGGKDLVSRLPEKIRKEAGKNDLRRLSELGRKIEGLRKMRPSVAMEFILYGCSYYENILERPENCEEIISDIEELEEMADKIGTCKDLLDFADGYSDFLKRGKRKTPVILGTLHSVKGMEFDNVIIPDLCSGVIPHARSMDDLEAERRLFYVGVTRSRRDLLLIFPEVLNGQRMAESPFVKNLNI